MAPLAAGLTDAADPMGCAPLLSVVAEAYKLSSEAGQGQPFMAALVAQPALLDRVRDCLSDEHPDAAGAEGERGWEAWCWVMMAVCACTRSTSRRSRSPLQWLTNAGCYSAPVCHAGLSAAISSPAASPALAANP